MCVCVIIPSSPYRDVYVYAVVNYRYKYKNSVFVDVASLWFSLFKAKWWQVIQFDVQVSAYLAMLTWLLQSSPPNIFITSEDFPVYLNISGPVFIQGYRNDVDTSTSSGHFSFRVFLNHFVLLRVVLLPECKSLSLALMWHSCQHQQTSGWICPVGSCL